MAGFFIDAYDNLKKFSIGLYQQNSQNYFVVDNSGKGNCGYYAYGISLLVWLKFFPEHIDKVFSRFSFNNQEEEALKRIINAIKLSDKIFIPDVKKIEEILGPALRKLVAERAIEEFNNYHAGCRFVQSVQNQFQKIILCQLRQEQSQATRQAHGVFGMFRSCFVRKDGELSTSISPRLIEAIGNGLASDDLGCADILMVEGIKGKIKEFILQYWNDNKNELLKNQESGSVENFFLKQ